MVRAGFRSEFPPFSFGREGFPFGGSGFVGRMPLVFVVKHRAPRGPLVGRWGWSPEMRPDRLPIQTKFSGDLGNRIAKGAESMDHKGLLLSDHGSSLAGSWDSLPEWNSIDSSGARHLIVSSQEGGEFSIAITGEFTIGVDSAADSGVGPLDGPPEPGNPGVSQAPTTLAECGVLPAIRAGVEPGGVLLGVRVGDRLGQLQSGPSGAAWSTGLQGGEPRQASSGPGPGVLEACGFLLTACVSLYYAKINSLTKSRNKDATESQRLLDTACLSSILTTARDDREPRAPVAGRGLLSHLFTTHRDASCDSHSLLSARGSGKPTRLARWTMTRSGDASSIAASLSIPGERWRANRSAGSRLRRSYKPFMAVRSLRSIRKTNRTQAVSSCRTLTGRPIHIVGALVPDESRFIVITTYQPDQDRWEMDFKRRRRS